MENKYFNEERKNWCLVGGEEEVREYDECITLDPNNKNLQKWLSEKSKNSKYILLGEGYGMNYTTDGELQVWKEKCVFYKYAR